MKTINVNGFTIYHNKNGVSINGETITFSDGSYVNTKTGEIVNNGKGAISFSDHQKVQAKGKEETIEKEFTKITDVSFKHLPASINVKLSSNQKTKMVAEGISSIIEDIEIDQQNNTLSIIGKKNGYEGAHNISIRNIRGGSVSIINGRISIGGDTVISTSSNNTIITNGTKPSLEITLYVPKGTSLDFENIEHDTSIEDINGHVRISSQTGSDFTLGKTKSLSYQGQGSSDIDIAELTGGSIFVSTQGNSDVNINSGIAESIQLNRQGSGDFSFYGTAKSAMGSIMGSGSVKISRVEQPHAISIMGSGKLNIGQ